MTTAPPAVAAEVVLRSYPQGRPHAEDFAAVQSPVPSPGKGEALLRVLWASIDPAMRTWSAQRPGRGSPLPLGSVMRAYAVAEVVQSDRPGLEPGDIVVGPFGLREWHVTDGRDVRRCLPAHMRPVRLGLGILGHIGLTAYIGILRIADAQPGETVLVSSAAGAVGGLAGQIAALRGCRVIGIAGGPEKVALARTEYGFVACLDRHAVDDLDVALAAVAPDGIDVYFDNVGGPTLDAALRAMNARGRVAVCGTISVSSQDPGMGPRPERLILDRELAIRGFLTSSYDDEAADMLADLWSWFQDGRLRLREDIEIGLARAPEALARQLAGDHLGKVLVRVADDAHEPTIHPNDPTPEENP